MVACSLTQCDGSCHAQGYGGSREAMGKESHCSEFDRRVFSQYTNWDTREGTRGGRWDRALPRLPSTEKPFISVIQWMKEIKNSEDQYSNDEKKEL